MTDYRCSHHNLCSEQRREKVPCFVKELSEIIRDSIMLSAPIKLRAIGKLESCQCKHKEKIYPCKHTLMYYIFLTEPHSQPLPAQLQFVFHFRVFTVAFIQRPILIISHMPQLVYSFLLRGIHIRKLFLELVSLF